MQFCLISRPILRAFSLSSRVCKESQEPWFGLSSEQKEIRAVARKFAREEMAPGDFKEFLRILFQ